MADPVLFANNAGTTLALPITSSATSATLNSGTGALFPNPSAGQFFALTLISAANATIMEIVYCTARAGDVVTITRAQEGTAALAWNAGDIANNQVTAGTLEYIENYFVTPPQVANTYPVGTSTSVSGTTVSATSSALTAPSNGYAMVYGFTSVAPLANSLTTAVLTASLAGLVTLVVDYNGSYDSHWGYLPMTAGQSSTFTMAGTQTNSTVMTASVVAFFVPLP